MDTRAYNDIDTPPATRSKLVWDLPVRIFHWSLVILLVAAWFTGEGDRWLDIHVFAGYAILGLILFRVLWGFRGTHYARFRQFSYSLARGREYLLDTLQGKATTYVGHNPAGSWAIYLLLGGVFLTAVSGFFVFGAEEGHGPAGPLASGLLGWLAKNIHNGLAWLLLAVAAVHIGGVVFESFRLGEKLIPGMITGRKQVPAGTPGVPARKGVAVALLLLLGGYFLSAGIGLVPGKEAFREQFTGEPLAMSETWQEECGACHLAYNPVLLPSRSWRELLNQQHDHFGEDLYLADSTLQELRDYATANSADRGITEASRKITASLNPAETPLRITDTRYWRYKHENIAPAIWQQSNVNGKAQCSACHSDAAEGWFEDARMKIPALPDTAVTDSPDG
ncbi:MAG: cytochrome b/b6 domain-containing protein [Gammaproteobacteria bacterium]